MKLLKLVVVLLIFITAVAGAPTSSTTEPSNHNDDGETSQDDLEQAELAAIRHEADIEENDPDRVLLALDYDTKVHLASLLSEPRSRQEWRDVLGRTIDMIDHRPKAHRERRRESVNEAAKTLGKALLGDFGSTSDESVAERPPSPEFCPDSSNESRLSMNVATMKKILELRASGRSHASIQKLYPRYRRDRIDTYQRLVNQGEPVVSKIKQVNEHCLKNFEERRKNAWPVHGDHIKRWAKEKAAEVGLSRHYFAASPTWLWKFKNTRIGTRRVTDYVTRIENDEQGIIQERVEGFLSNYTARAWRFNRRLIWNFDQSPIQYEHATKRTLSWKGEKETKLLISQKNKVTHSFTIQPVISRDGRLIGKLLLVMQETNGTFGIRVRERVRRQEEEYGNIRVLASKSGDLMIPLIHQWIREVLTPASREELRSTDTDTEINSEFDTMSLDDDAFESMSLDRESTDDTIPYCNDSPGNGAERCVQGDKRGPNRRFRRNHTLLIGDSFSPQANAAANDAYGRIGLEYLMVPKKCTRYVQPLDVGFNLQFKKLWKRISDETYDPRNGYTREQLVSREGIINLMSLIWNQFSSEAYTDMLRYCWRNTDPHFSLDELSRSPPVRGVNEIQFRFDDVGCQHRDHATNESCTRPGVIKCAHCGKVLCLKHFMDRVCFHNASSDIERAGPSGEQQQQRHQLDDDFDSDYENDPDLFTNRGCPATTARPTTARPTTARPTTTTTTSRAPVYRSSEKWPPHDELAA